MNMENESLFPAFKENNIPICMACSNAYCIFACVTINSIITNSSKKYNYDIVVLNTDISENNKNKILSITQGKVNISLRFIDVTKYIASHNFYTWDHFTSATYYRLLVPDIFSEYQKVIYVDSDVIVNHDISELYAIDLTGWLMGAARDTHVIGRLNRKDIKPTDYSLIEEIEYFIDQVGVEDGLSYFQCGVSIYNILEFHKAFESGWLLKEVSTRKLKWMDQDFMNIIAKGRIKPIDNKWNVMVINNPNKIDEKHLIGEIYDEYWNARKNPYIVHYVGKSIPCFKPSADFYDLYWKYARTTPYYEIMIATMIDYKISNAATKFTATAANNTNKKEKHTLKKFFKNKIIIPIIDLFFPKGSLRRDKLKKKYFKIRGWNE